MLAHRPALLAATLLAALLLAAPAAGAGYRTKVVVSLKFPAFHGKVRSAKRACTKHRKVKLYRRHSGHKKLLGTDRTNAKGRWIVPVGKKLAPGAYFAKAPARGRCRAAKSNVVPIA